MRASFDVLLSRYAQLITHHGLNIQPGQLLVISAEVAHRELALKVAESAYARGAKHVTLDLIEPRMQRIRVAHSTLEQMKYVPRSLGPKYDELVEEMGANLKIVGPEDPDVLKGLDATKLNTGRIANYHAVKRLYEEGIDKSRVHWTVVAAATQGWASRIFPKLSPQEAEAKLWENLFSICRVDREDFLDAWREHNALLHERARKLTDLQIESLHFTGPGTDLLVGLSPRALFKGGSDLSPRGVSFEPNLPTEECFTTPNWRKTTGTVTATRPFFINGTLIKGLWMRFERGEIADFKAESGEATFREYISSDEGGRRLGEVALVGIDSPVYRSGLVFEEILLDENAACHIAVGSAYKFCVKDSAHLSKESLAEIGCNESSVHTDMMISSEQVDVVAQLRDGSSTVLIRNGSWATFR
jgi:aminopeptidase